MTVYRIILASASPRRQELLKMITPEFTCQVPDFDESPVMSAGLSAEETACRLSLGKAEAASEQFGSDEDTVYIAGDTVVASPNGEILGKPADEEDAARMLRMLSGKTHRVITGVTLSSAGKHKTFSSITEVDFYPLSDEEINSYIKTGEPLDKAGAYGIQSLGGLFVKGIRGDYYNVVGLPVPALMHELRDF